MWNKLAAPLSLPHTIWENAISHIQYSFLEKFAIPQFNRGGKNNPVGIKQSVQYTMAVGMWWYRKKFSWITVSTIGTNHINFEHFWAILTNFNFFLENKNFWEKKLQMRTVLHNENLFLDFRLPGSIFFLQNKDKSIMFFMIRSGPLLTYKVGATAPPVFRFAPPLELVLPLKKCPFYKKAIIFLLGDRTQRDALQHNATWFSRN